MFCLKKFLTNFPNLWNAFTHSIFTFKLYNPVNFIKFLSNNILVLKTLSKGSNDYKLMEEMTELWTSFAKNG